MESNLQPNQEGGGISLWTGMIMVRLFTVRGVLMGNNLT